MKRHLIVVISIVAGLGMAGYAGWTLWPSLLDLGRSLGLTVSLPGQTTTFAVVGDNHGATEVYQQILDDVQTEGVDVLLNLADTSEHGTRAEFQAVHDLESRYEFSTIHVVGGHDIKADANRGVFTEVFGARPCAIHSLGHLRLIVLDNADRLVGFPDECLDWLETTLASVTDRPVILAFHRPFDLPFGDIIGDDETAASRRSNERFRRIVTEHQNIIHVLTAHLHTYLPFTLAGIPATVSGGGGDPAQSVLGGSKNNNFHYLVVTVNDRNVDLAVRRVQLTD